MKHSDESVAYKSCLPLPIIYNHSLGSWDPCFVGGAHLLDPSKSSQRKNTEQLKVPSQAETQNRKSLSFISASIMAAHPITNSCGVVLP